MIHRKKTHNEKVNHNYKANILHPSHLYDTALYTKYWIYISTDMCMSSKICVWALCVWTLLIFATGGWIVYFYAPLSYNDTCKQGLLQDNIILPKRIALRGNQGAPSLNTGVPGPSAPRWYELRHQRPPNGPPLARTAALLAPRPIDVILHRAHFNLDHKHKSLQQKWCRKI